MLPHAVIRAKLATPEALKDAPETFERVPQPGYRNPLGAGICPPGCIRKTAPAAASAWRPARPADKTNSSRRAINLVPVQSVLNRDKANWTGS